MEDKLSLSLYKLDYRNFMSVLGIRRQLELITMEVTKSKKELRPKNSIQ